jgi:hypothetical protein
VDTLWLKLILTPLLIGSASLAGRRYGAAVGGWLVGLPLTSAPVVFFLALERGTDFASDAAEGTLVGLVSVAAFCLAYGLVAPRRDWLFTLLSSLAAFFGATLVLRPVDLPLLLSFLAVIGVLGIVLRSLPLAGAGGAGTPELPGWDLPARVVVATAFVLLLTGSAGILGPRLSGLLAPLPIFVGVLAVFAHFQQGGVAAAGSVRGTVVGSFAFAAFFLVVAGTVERAGILVAFAGGTLAALAVQAASLLWLKKKT